MHISKVFLLAFRTADAACPIGIASVVQYKSAFREVHIMLQDTLKRSAGSRGCHWQDSRLCTIGRPKRTPSACAFCRTVLQSSVSSYFCILYVPIPDCCMPCRSSRVAGSSCARHELD